MASCFLYRRRAFITLIGGAAAAWPLAAPAQQPAMPVIGLLNPGSAGPSTALVDGFRRGLAETGYVEGRNVATEFRWADGHYDQLPELAADLVRRQVAVIAALGSSAPGLAAKAATSTIPIVFQTGADPVADGLVAGMNRPGGNVTGVSRMSVATDPKRLELLHEAVPMATVIACLVNPTSPRAENQIRQLQASARSLGLKLEIAKASSESDLASAFAAMVKAGATALFVPPDPSYTALDGQIALWAVRHAMPTMFPTRLAVTAGGLMSYDSSTTDSLRQAGVYVGRVLKGEKPADLPVLQPTRFELVINLKVAKVLGVTIPEAFLLRADEVIE
jgi:putative tryptophan/tyrosine transport system substrate-binding protein